MCPFEGVCCTARHDARPCAVRAFSPPRSQCKRIRRCRPKEVSIAARRGRPRCPPTQNRSLGKEPGAGSQQPPTPGHVVLCSLSPPGSPRPFVAQPGVSQTAPDVARQPSLAATPHRTRPASARALSSSAPDAAPHVRPRPSAMSCSRTAPSGLDGRGRWLGARSAALLGGPGGRCGRSGGAGSRGLALHHHKAARLLHALQTQRHNARTRAHT